MLCKPFYDHSYLKICIFSTIYEIFNYKVLFERCSVFVSIYKTFLFVIICIVNIVQMDWPNPKFIHNIAYRFLVTQKMCISVQKMRRNQSKSRRLVWQEPRSPTQCIDSFNSPDFIYERPGVAACFIQKP